MYGFSLDWLSVTLDRDDVVIRDYLVDRLTTAFGVTFDVGRGYQGYEFSLRSSGAVIAWGGRSQGGTLHLSLSGDGASVLQWYGSAALLRALIKRFDVRVKFTRIDLALDLLGDKWRYFDSPDRVYKLIEDHRITKVSFVQSYERDDNDVPGERQYKIDGFTCYIGARTSERFMRIYRKRLYNGTKVTRFEYELKQRYALVVGGMMLGGKTIQEAYIFANTNHIDLSAVVDLSLYSDQPSESLPRKKDRDSLLWLKTISAFIVDFMDRCPVDWSDVLSFGRMKLYGTPYGNTGVQIPYPADMAWIDERMMNLYSHGIEFTIFDSHLYRV